MSGSGTVQDLNRELARQINEEARNNPQSPYANRFVGIANGQVVVVADSFDEMARRLRQIEPDPSKCSCVEASRDYSVVEEIWGLFSDVRSFRPAARPRIRPGPPCGRRSLGANRV